jgi:ribosomal protein L28
MRCQICHKKPVVGNKVIRTGTGKWIKKRVKVVRKPNLQKATLLSSGQEEKIIVCTACLKKLKKTGQVKTYSSQ